MGCAAFGACSIDSSTTRTEKGGDRIVSPYSPYTATNHLEVLHRAACRVITGCLSSTPSSLLLLEAQLPPLKLTLEHQTLYSFERALRLPPDFSSLYALAIKNVPCRLKKKPSWRSSCSSATQPLPSPRESLITCPPFPPWSTTHFTVSPFIPDCTGSSTARLQITYGESESESTKGFCRSQSRKYMPVSRHPVLHKNLIKM